MKGRRDECRQWRDKGNAQEVSFPLFSLWKHINKISMNRSKSVNQNQEKSQRSRRSRRSRFSSLKSQVSSPESQVSSPKSQVLSLKS